MKTNVLFMLLILANGCFGANVYRFGPFVQPEDKISKASDLALKTNPGRIMEILKSKDPVKRKYLAKCFGVEEFAKTECWKEEYKKESVILEKQQQGYDVLFYRYIADQSGRGTALFLFYKNEGKEQRFVCMLEFQEGGAQVNNAEGTFEYKWQSVVDGNEIKELVMTDKFGGHAASEKVLHIFKVFDGDVKEIFTGGLGGYQQVANFKYESYEAIVAIEEKGDFPRKIEYSDRDTRSGKVAVWQKSNYIWDDKSREYIKSK